MQSSYVLMGRSSSDGGGGGGLFLPSRKPTPFFGLWGFSEARWRRPPDRPAPVAAATEQDHYAILGIPRTASAADVKRAYRLLARKYHPDVSRELKAGEVFKSIRFAYEVLSDEVSRTQYDMTLLVPGARDQPWKRKWNYESKFEDWRIHRWAELRQRMRYEERKRKYSWDYQEDRSQETAAFERESFSEVLRFAFFTLLLMQIIGHRASLTLCGLAALLDKELDLGYKIGYFTAWLLGGQVGILLTLCINFASWLCGKNNSSLVALVIMAMWVGANLARFAPIPQGAVLTLLYMSIKLQVDSK